MKKLKSVILLIVITFFVNYSADAQRFSKKKQYWSVGGSINAMNYVGDITNSKSRFSVPFKFTRQNIGVEVLRRMSPKMSYRGNFFYGRMKSDDRQFGDEPVNGGPGFGRWHRGATFVNTVYELTGQVIYDLYENRGNFGKRPDYTPYAFIGLGAFYHNPKFGAGGQAISSQSWASFSTFQAAFLYGLGFRYKLDKRWDLALEIGWRITTTDMLDGVKGEYWKDTDGWSAAQIALYDKSAIGTSVQVIDGHNYTVISRPAEGEYSSMKEAQKNGALRGNLAKDGYIVTGLHLTRIMGGGVICPKFR